MKTLKANIQKSTEKIWVDESGNQVQYSRLSQTEKLSERVAGKILQESIKLHNALSELKEYIARASQEVYEMYYKERNLTPEGKGNYTFYNFDRTIKVEINVNDRIEFDELGIKAAKELFDEFLSEQISTKLDVIKQLVLEAFSTRNGKLDVKKIMNLIRYKSKVNEAKFIRAVEILEQSIRKPSSRMYFRIYQRQPGGEWENIDLNFSSI